GHLEVHSSSLVPHNDPTLLFTNAGMNQFKDVFLGLEKRDYRRATSSQKCVRAGGKHNDLENVGFTNRHHTFFEMLGNFSFGDYFKKDAINYAWELVTSPEWFAISKDKLYVTIFKGEGNVPRDSDAYDLWLAQGVDRTRVFEFGLEDNFWQMGDTGPCGPCSEIHYDLGPAASDQQHRDCAFGCQCGRYVEIWNLVFMQFDRDVSGKLNPLPKPSIDTGMGLERVTAVLQGVISNYETDLFRPLIQKAADLTGSSHARMAIDPSSPATEAGHGAASLRVIADHARAATFLISDGVLPANEGRGYVLRKIVRRAITHGRLLGQSKPFLNQMVFAVRDLMQDAYPELKQAADRAAKAVLAEETRFARTLDLGLKRLEELLEEAKNRGAMRIDGHSAFKLYDTFGLPLDFMQDAARDRAIEFDSLGFESAMSEQRERARASWKGASKQTANPAYQQLPKTIFEGYTRSRSEDCQVLAIVKDGRPVEELRTSEEADVMVDHTPFYAEAGGQVGDRGNFYSHELNAVIGEVKGCYYPIQGIRAHRVVAKGLLHVGAKLDAVVDIAVRQSTMRNHTATHLLHAGLREVLGKHVKQAGSLVAANHLRFDFSHFAAVEEEELQDIEDLINREVLRNQKVQVIDDVPLDVAINEYKAMALFGEKYGDRVRVIKIGDFSAELCGGTHTQATGEIGLIKILKEGSVASGVRRVEAVTGEGSLEHFRRDHALENVVAGLMAREAALPPADALKAELERRDAEIKRLGRENDQLRMKQASSSMESLSHKIREVHGVKVLAHRVDNLERPQMRNLVDQLRQKLGSGVVVLGSAANGSVALIVGVTKDLTSRIQAGKVVGQVAEHVGGKGGGRPDLAEAGGKDSSALDMALSAAYDIVSALIK
ncbi:MAG: alanine--tRNA ligase, partial [Acidobacteriaceae bacterium]|nr:alanine--tRNA ligase [Acidobacteriaceae bacterium]